MLSIKLNNAPLTVDAKLNLADLLAQQGFLDAHFAVAINQNFVARSRYAETYLQEGDVVETVAPMQGG